MLCSICQSLKISGSDFLIQPDDKPDRFEKSHDLGSLYFIRQKSSRCALCSLLVTAAGGSHNPFSQEDEDIQCKLHWQEDGLLWGKNGYEVRCLRVSTSKWPPHFNEFNRIIPIADSVLESRGLFLGRVVDNTTIDVKLLRKWLKACQNWHGQECEQASTSSEWTPPPNMRMVDAWDRCIVQAPSNCRFLALSYVWGSGHMFKLTKNNLLQLQVKGALKSLWQILPNTIQDAILLTSSLSIRYIWIDSLCIMQDDSTDKDSLIPYIHMIYDRAFVTLVATGEDAQAGLPGIGSRPRDQQQKLEAISPNLRLMCPKHITDALDQSVYESRAWTFQENTFSRRCFIFAQGLVMFRCRCALWREDVCLEHVDVQDSFDMMFKHCISGKTSVKEPHDDYAGSLYEYSSRRLTYDSDILNAFAGILDVLCERMSGERNPELEQVYGLPTYIFDWAILWEFNKSGRRRSGEWPSWSWCGSVGTASMALNSMDYSQLEHWLRYRTWINWLIYDRNGRPMMRIPSQATYHRNKTASARFQQFASRIPIPNAPPPASKVQTLQAYCDPNHSHSITGTYSALIHLTTLSVTMYLMLTPHLVHDSEISSTSYRYTIHQKHDDQMYGPYGTIWLNGTKHQSHDPLQAHEFLVLSEAPRRLIKNEDFRSRYSKPETGAQSDDEWAAYFVMLVTREPSNEEIVERMGLGVVHREAIDMALNEGGPHAADWKEIWLR